MSMLLTLCTLDNGFSKHARAQRNKARNWNIEFRVGQEYIVAGKRKATRRFSIIASVPWNKVSIKRKCGVWMFSLIGLSCKVQLEIFRHLSWRTFLVCIWNLLAISKPILVCWTDWILQWLNTSNWKTENIIFHIFDKILKSMDKLSPFIPDNFKDIRLVLLFKFEHPIEDPTNTNEFVWFHRESTKTVQ